MKLRQGPIDCVDCSFWLLLDLVLVNFCWVHETNSFISLPSHLIKFQATENERQS
jgi:hypothetical protein